MHFHISRKWTRDSFAEIRELEEREREGKHNSETFSILSGNWRILPNWVNIINREHYKPIGDKKDFFFFKFGEFSFSLPFSSKRK